MCIYSSLTIEGDRLISLPLKEDDAQAIKSIRQQAPFGHDNKTVVDTPVRNKWELDDSKFNLANKELNKYFCSKLLLDTARGLGLQLEGEPHKLLLYEPGSFFKPHKDSEKKRGMIGTLVQSQDLKSMLAKFQTDFPQVQRLLYPLDHLYTEPILRLRNLKGRGRAVGRCLNEICPQAGFYFMLGHTTHFKVEIDDCSDDEDKDSTNLKTLYNLNGDQVFSDLVLNLDDFLGYDIEKEHPNSEDEGGYTGNDEAPLVFHYRQLREHYDRKEQAIDWNQWIQHLAHDDVPAEAFDKFYIAFKPSTKHPPLLESFQAGSDPIFKEKIRSQSSWEYNHGEFIIKLVKSRSGDEEWINKTAGSFKESPDLYKSTLECAGKQLCLSAEEPKYRPVGSRSGVGLELIQLLKEACLNCAGREALQVLELNCVAFHDNKET
ncbi:2og-fe oxygenase superfamily [Fusarium beomiforme]|uniref:2og-fe oxygenase superfamily n=1 Tax=Fusarium beomiforme TaxID=44412 RepID=A0A9P5A7B9_9HYPO|nr:2og-fe oxygenase superfamily [Fusarium beomiforme]